MSARALSAAALFVVLAGCGKPPEGTVGPTLSVNPPTNRSEQKRALAGKEVATVGPVTAEVTGWRVGKPKRYNNGYSGPTHELDRECLAVEVKFSTSSPNVSKHSFGDLFSQAAVKDEFGNAYYGVSSPGNPPVGTSENRVVQSGKPVVEVWLFEKPIPTAKTLTLDFSAKCVELGEGEFRFTIPLK